jgi:hypothetical protein
MRTALAIVFALAACQKTEKPKIELAELQPTSGAPGGGKVVQIVGKGFDTRATVEVRFGSRLARAIVVAPDRIQLESPPGAEGEEVEVSVRFPDGRGGKVPQRYRWVTPQ